MFIKNRMLQASPANPGDYRLVAGAHKTGQGDTSTSTYITIHVHDNFKSNI
jgi:hypothetical protein